MKRLKVISRQYKPNTLIEQIHQLERIVNGNPNLLNYTTSVNKPRHARGDVALSPAQGRPASSAPGRHNTHRPLSIPLTFILSTHASLPSLATRQSTRVYVSTVTNDRNY